jgi:hypothetical protein
MTTTLQYHDHAIERCDATTGHAVVTVALCRDTATARMLVDAYNSHERAQSDLEAAQKRMTTTQEKHLREQRDTAVANCDKAMMEIGRVNEVLKASHEREQVLREALVDSRARVCELRNSCSMRGLACDDVVATITHIDAATAPD